jgi:hypothetical protein
VLVAPPEVGCVYLVPTVRACWYYRLDDWPVFGPLHDDEEVLNTPVKHYHLDPRFLTHEQWEYGITQISETGSYAASYGRSAVFQDVVLRFKPGNGFTAQPRLPVLRQLTCLREWPPRPFQPRCIEKLEDAYAGFRLDSRLSGPHKGMPLASLPVQDGIRVSPAHGLIWCAETGRLVRRRELEQASP